ncbi:uncharacterized protein [Primulina huaijiensis]|uniref:uncharacterized protein isoform X1 n=1 Tax=Primulina huaijiensis TaxID=1492673 RepID=UPI003CC77CBE
MPTLISSLPNHSSTWIQKSYPFSGILFKGKSNRSKQNLKPFNARIMAATEGSAKNQSKSKEEEVDNGDDSSVPSWARPGSDEAPPWARQEAQKDSTGFELPFYVYLLSSAVAAVAAIGSIFEYANERPVFGILNSDSVFYAPLLGFFVSVGIPASAFLWFKSVEVANKEAEEQDRRDGFS